MCGRGEKENVKCFRRRVLHIARRKTSDAINGAIFNVKGRFAKCEGKLSTSGIRAPVVLRSMVI